MHRRRFLAIFTIGITAVVAGCAPGTNLDPTCDTPDGCSPLAAPAGYNQYDLLYEVYNGQPPTDRRFEFQVLRDGHLVAPEPDEFVIASATDGPATERSYNPDQTELYIFAAGETVVFYEVFDS